MAEGQGQKTYLPDPPTTLHLNESQHRPGAASRQMIQTSIGEIAVWIKERPGSIPVLFLHGVYFDHRLWDYQVGQIEHHTTIAIDMPLHGESKKVSTDWNLEDCGTMLIELLDTLQIAKAIAIGHSWGSMVILRAASKFPDRFLAVGLCNMPFQAASRKGKRQFQLQHLLLGFRNFYTRQIAKFQFGTNPLESNPSLLHYLRSSFSKLTNKEVKLTDQKVILEADDASEKVKQLKVIALGLKGREDYVPAAEGLQYVFVEGGHVSPIEVPDKVLAFVKRVVRMGSPEQ